VGGPGLIAGNGFLGGLRAAGRLGWVTGTASPHEWRWAPCCSRDRCSLAWWTRPWQFMPRFRHPHSAGPGYFPSPSELRRSPWWFQKHLGVAMGLLQFRSRAWPTAVCAPDGPCALTQLAGAGRSGGLGWSWACSCCVRLIPFSAMSRARWAAPLGADPRAPLPPVAAWAARQGAGPPFSSSRPGARCLLEPHRLHYWGCARTRHPRRYLADIVRGKACPSYRGAGGE